MTVQELVDISPNCDLLEVTVRQGGHGWWLQAYRIGKRAKIFPSEVTKEVRELKQLRDNERSTISLKAGEIIDTKIVHGFPIKVICKDCHKLPREIGGLEICSVQPRNIPIFHGSSLAHNEFSYDVNCYPTENTQANSVENKNIFPNELPGQMTFNEWLLPMQEVT